MGDTGLYTKTSEESALHKVVKGGHEEVVAKVESWVQLGLRNYDGKDFLMMIVEVNSVEISHLICDL